MYYNSKKPRDPRLPIPTYRPHPDMEINKDGTKLDK